MRWLALVCVAACGFPQPADVGGAADAGTDAATDAPSGPRFLSFSLRMQDNPSVFVHDLIGIIDEQAHTIALPGFALRELPPTTYVPAFEVAHGEVVTVGGQVQASGQSLQAFTTTTQYDLALGDEHASYQVTLLDREPTTVNSTTISGTISQIVTGDLDLDKHDDFVVLTASGGSFFAQPVRCLATGTIDTELGTKLALPPATDRIALADLNSDGRPDLIAHGMSGGAGLVAVAFDNSSPVTLSFASTINVPCAAGASVVAAGEVTGDAYNDLVAGTSTSIYACPNQGPAKLFALGPASMIGAPGCVPTRISVLDVDGDGTNEVVAACANQERIVVFTRGTDAWSMQAYDAPTVSPSQAAVGDLYGGVRALVLGNLSNHSISVLQPSTQAGTLLQTGGDLTAFALADYDGDGWPDVALLDKASPIWLGTPGTTLPSFAPPQGPKPMSIGPIDVATGDFNGDGHPDAIFATPTTVQLMLME